MKVGLTYAAEADLESIGDAIAKEKDKPRRAVSFISEIRDCREGLGRCRRPSRVFRAMRIQASAGVSTAPI